MIYAKVGAILAILAGAFWAGWAINGDRATTAANALHAAQLATVVKTLEGNIAQAQAEVLAKQKVIDAYDATKDIPDPASIGTAHRVLIVAASAGSCPVPETAAVAGGVADAARVAVGPSVVEQRLNDYIQACGRDAKKLIAAQALAPH